MLKKTTGTVSHVAENGTKIVTDLLGDEKESQSESSDDDAESDEDSRSEKSESEKSESTKPTQKSDKDSSDSALAGVDSTEKSVHGLAEKAIKGLTGSDRALGASGEAPDERDTTLVFGPSHQPQVALIMRTQTRRRSDAQRDSSYRLDSCVLRSTLDTCVSTVFTEMNSSPAISL